jgi:hypothetical protein
MLLKAVGSSHLPNEVLNLLVHQILIEEGENSLMQGNFYTRIRDLESAGATTLKKALAFFSDKEATPLQPRKSTKKQRVKTRGGKKEVIPDYVQNREKSEEVTSNNDINEVKDLFNNL